MKRLIQFLAVLAVATIAMVAANNSGNDFDPQSPAEPYKNYYNPATGELLIREHTDKTLDDAIDAALLGYAPEDVRQLVLSCPVDKYEQHLLAQFTGATIIDLGDVTGLKDATFALPDLDFTGDEAMSNQLVELILPNCITSIGTMEWALHLERLECRAMNPPAVPERFLYRKENYFGSTYDRLSVNIYVPAESVERYRQAPGWREFDIYPIGEAGEQTLGSITLSLLTPDDEDVATAADIRWTNAEGADLGTGVTLRGLQDGQEVACLIALPYELAMQYRTPGGQMLKASDSDQQVDIHLVPWPADILDGTKLQLNASLTTLDGKQHADAFSQLDLNDLVFEIIDLGTGEVLDDVQFSMPQLRIGHKLSAGDRLRVRMTSRSRAFCTAEADITIAKHVTATANFALVESCKAVITYTQPANASHGYMCLVFGADGRRLMTVRGIDNRFELPGLPDGEITAVVLWQSDQYATVPDLATLDRLGNARNNGTRLTFTAQAGQTQQLETTLPVAEATIRYYRGSQTLSNSNPAVGFYTTLSLMGKPYDSAPEFTDESILVDLPEGIELVEGSVLSKRERASYYLDGRRLVVPGTSNITLCVVSYVAGDYQLNSYIGYHYGSTAMTEPLCTTPITYSADAVGGTTIVNTPTVTIYGTASPFARVTIYDGLTPLGNTLANAVGEWATCVDVDMRYPKSYHSLYGQYETTSGTTYTEEFDVYAAPDAPVLEHVWMMSEDNILVETTPSLREPSPSYYNFVPDKNFEFTFLAQFSNADPADILVPRFHVRLSDGCKALLRAHYDEELQAFTSHAGFGDPNRLPVDVSFDYTFPEQAYSQALGDMILTDDATYLKSYLEAFQRIMERELQDVEIIDDSQQRLEALLRFDGADEPLHLRMRQENYDDVVALQTGCNEIVFGSRVDGDSVTMVTFDDEQYTITYYTLPDERQAASVAYYYDEQVLPDQQAHGPMRIAFIPAAVAVVSWLGTGASVIGHANAAMQLHEFDKDNRSEQVDKMLRNYRNRTSAALRSAQQAINAYCPTGKPRLGQAKPIYDRQWQDLMLRRAELLERLQADVNAMEQAKANLIANEKQGIATDVVLAFGGGSLLGTVFGKGSKMAKAMINLKGKHKTIKDIGGALDGVAAAKEAEINGGDTDMNAHYNRIMEWAPKAFNQLQKDINTLYSTVVSNYTEDCKEDIDREVITVEEDPNDNKRKKIRPIHDPSGFVYEGVESNRLEDVLAQLYYREDEQTAEDDAILWDAAEYGQENPLYTDADGLYRWDVPQGWWQVRFSKEGYADARTEWLPVPPPQLDVNVAMTSIVAPEVVRAVAYTDAIYYDFGQYMRIDGVRQQTQVTAAGSSCPGTITALNAELDGQGQELATQFRFEPAEAFTTQVVTLNVSRNADNYCGNTMSNDYSQTLDVNHALKSLSVEMEGPAYCHTPAIFIIQASPAQAVSGKTVNAACSNIFSDVDLSDAEFNEDGIAYVYVTSSLPGTTSIDFSVCEQHIVKSYDVDYLQPNTVMEPIASYLSGAALPAGTAVELFCVTPGAVIYYTTDGSCPCDDTPARQLYTEPIIVTSDITIRAMAECEDMPPSAVQVFTYTVTAADIETLHAEPAAELIYTIEGQRVQRPLTPGIYITVSTQPEGVARHKFVVE